MLGHVVVYPQRKCEALMHLCMAYLLAPLVAPLVALVLYDPPGTTRVVNE